MTFSAETYTVWAPHASAVGLVLDADDTEPLPMSKATGGWWTSPVRREHGQRYGFCLTDSAGAVGPPRPDPRSARQPDGVHALSAVHRLDPNAWSDSHWTGRQLAGSIIYELHIGTFSTDGTLRSAIAHLDELVDLGVTMVELMPLASFSGTHGWGYDGVLWYSVHEAYGGPDALQEFVNACHLRGLAVCLDVVYNHFGPSGNYLPEFGPYLGGGDTGWGESLNLDGPNSTEVRQFIIDNAIRWFSDFHIDALRLDAVHALRDTSALHILEELSIATETASTHLARPLSLIAESDLNDSRVVTTREAGGLGLSAQWDDDIHHAIHAAISGERQGYYADFGSLDNLRRVLTGAFFHAGTYSQFRQRIHGRPVDRDRTPASRFVAYTQTHDQVGNRAAGDRPAQHHSPEQLLAAFALVVCSPFTPMIFQGEEWGAKTPFCFFTSHVEPELAEATRTGRLQEFAAMGWDPSSISDPQDPATFLNSKLDWSERSDIWHQGILDSYRALIHLRRTEAALSDPQLNSVRVEVGTEEPDNRWLILHRGELALAINLGPEACRIPISGKSLYSQAATCSNSEILCEPYGFIVIRSSL